jgi:hypothetical protein
MVRRGLLVIAILGLAACGQGERGAAEGTPGVGAVGGTAGSPYVKTCLEMQAAENWSEAARLCAMAAAAEPANEMVKSALAAANAALASTPEASSAVAAPSGEAAGEAADDAAGQVPEGEPN